MDSSPQVPGRVDEPLLDLLEDTTSQSQTSYSSQRVASGPSGIKKTERSCAICHRRKVRCDKKSPCTTCTRTGVLCYYPVDNKKAQTRQPKTTISDIASRLAQLERTLVAVSSVGSLSKHQEPPDEPQLSHTVARHGPSNGTEDSFAPTREGTPAADEMLVQNGASSRYINEALLACLLKEEKEIQSVMATPYPLASNIPPLNESPQPLGSEIPLLGLFSGHALASPASLHGIPNLRPTTRQATQLWDIYVQNVDPLYKVLHVPTEQLTIFSAISNPLSATPDTHCLLFAICLAAITILNPEEASAILGQEKTLLITHFKLGFELSLAQSTFLDQPTIRGIQALGIFLYCLRAHGFGRSIWILNGMLIRAAHSIGLHRDGTNFPGISVFDAEMRRRVWWHIWSADTRSAEDHGIAFNTLETSNDVQLPLNVDDLALDPELDHLPSHSPQKQQWTKMTLSLIMYEISRAIQKFHRIVSDTSNSDTITNSNLEAVESRRKDIVATLYTCIEELTAQCNLVIPIQRATVMMSQIVLRKFNFATQLQTLNLSARTTPAIPRTANATEDRLAEACDILGLTKQFLGDDLLRNWHWTGEMYPQYHIILYVLWHLCIRPTGSNIQRAWNTIDYVFETETSRRRRQGVDISSSKWAVFNALRRKALRVRTAAVPALGSDAVLITSPLMDAGSALNNNIDHSVENEGGNYEQLLYEDTMVDDPMVWDPGFVDWDSLAQNLGSGENLDSL